MSDLITIMESGEVVFTMNSGELRAWFVGQDGGLREISISQALQIERAR